MIEQEPSREEVAMELVDGVEESTSYRTQITELEREWMDDMGNADEVYDVFTAHSTLNAKSTYLDQLPTFEEEDWMDDMKNVYEVYEPKFTPRFAVPNPELCSPRIPLEICMLVIDHIGFPMHEIWADPLVKTLWSCCLSCHAFLNQSHRYLYRDVELNSCSKVKSFLGSITENANLQGLTTCITLDTSDVEAYHQLLLRGQGLLPKLEVLQLSEMPVLNPRLLSQPRPFPSVTVLLLERCQFPSVLDLRRLIDNFFPNISRLVVYDLKLASTYVTLPNKWPRKVVSLSSLNIDIDDWSPLERWLSSTPTKTSIRLLRMPYSQTRMLLSWGQNIEDLTLYKDRGYERNEAISLGPHLLPNLKYIKVDFDHDTTVFDFCAMFSKCHPSLTLMKVQLGFHGDISTVAFLQLDNTLSLLPPHVQVEISLGIHPYEEVEVHRKYWDGFPKLKEKGMLILS